MAGIITALTVQRRNSHRVNVFIDGEFAFGLQRDTAAWLATGRILTDEDIAAIRAKDESEVVYLSALRLLSYRQRSAAEMEKRLLHKGYGMEQVKVVVARLQENHLLDDRKFAEAWVNDRVTFHPRGKRLLAYELSNKGLDRPIIEQALTSISDENLLAEAAGRKMMKRWSDLAKKEFIQHCAAFLGRRGFPAGTCYSTARKLWEELHPGTDG